MKKRVFRKSSLRQNHKVQILVPSRSIRLFGVGPRICSLMLSPAISNADDRDTWRNTVKGFLVWREECCREHSGIGQRWSCAVYLQVCFPASQPLPRVNLPASDPLFLFLLPPHTPPPVPGHLQSPVCVSQPCSRPLPPSGTVCVWALSAECPKQRSTAHKVDSHTESFCLASYPLPSGGFCPEARKKKQEPPLKTWGRRDQGWHQRQRALLVWFSLPSLRAFE